MLMTRYFLPISVKFHFDGMFVVVVKQRNYVSFYFLSVNRKAYVFAALVEVFYMQTIPAVISVSFASLPGRGKSGGDVKSVVTAPKP